MHPPRAIAFVGTTRLAEGPLDAVAFAVASRFGTAPDATICVFDATDSRPIDLDLRGSAEDVRERYRTTRPLPASNPGTATDRTPDAPRGPGRPRLGVVPREVTLLPRHWDWLASQPGGASATLRRLVEQARAVNASSDDRRARTEAAYRFLHAMAGNAPGFEEAMRALFSGDAGLFAERIATWPPDVRDHALALLGGAEVERA